MYQDSMKHEAMWTSESDRFPNTGRDKINTPALLTAAPITKWRCNGPTTPTYGSPVDFLSIYGIRFIEHYPIYLSHRKYL